MSGYTTESDVRRIVHEELRAERRVVGPTNDGVRRIVREELRAERRVVGPTNDGAMALLEETAKLRRLLRAACSTLEGQYVAPESWSGELRAWRADDLRRTPTHTRGLMYAYQNGEDTDV